MFLFFISVLKCFDVHYYLTIIIPIYTLYTVVTCKTTHVVEMLKLSILQYIYTIGKIVLITKINNYFLVRLKFLPIFLNFI